MARRIPEERFDELIDGATEVFIANGYRRTQMADVAEAVGVAKGTLYGYVEGKEALFWLCLLWADRSGSVERPESLPVPTPRTGELSARVKGRLTEESVPPALAAALARPRAPDARAELEAVLRELYAMLDRYHRAIKLIDRCVDHPELGHLWQTLGREQSRAALARYLEKRIRAGQVRRVPNLRLAARLVIETLTTWAVHIRWDRCPEDHDPDEARENAIEFLVRGLLA